MFKPYSVKELLGYTGYQLNNRPKSTVVKQNLGQVIWFLKNSPFHSAYQKRKLFEQAVEDVSSGADFIASPFVIEGPQRGIAYLGTFPSKVFRSILIIFDSGRMEKIFATAELLEAANRERSRDYYRIDSENPFYSRKVEELVNQQLYKSEAIGELAIPM
tara:strand:- start:1923 stop:2402 length:480 start_codon:yes stop_codon:yes gene_type:complete